jgi:CRP-like cAMP-binding protein
MDASAKFRTQCNNRLLALLPDEELQEIALRIEILEFQYGHEITKRNTPITHIYFPCDCIGSIVTELASGQAVEIGAVGSEGMSSVMGFLGGKDSIDSMVCQIPGVAARLPIDVFRSATRDGTVFRDICGKYAQVYLSTACQSMACNRFHKTEQRLARWLLMSHDRVGRDDFPVTQEFMAIMLGTERPSVSIAAKILMDHGTIDYTRGKMQILDRPGLEAHACECYQFTRQQFKAIMGIDIG